VSAAPFALPGAVVALAWAALLAVAEGALAAQPKLMELALAGGYAEKPERFRRALALWRITLLALAAMGASELLHWWTAPWWRALPAMAGTVAALALCADLLPRAVGLWLAGRIGVTAVRWTAGSLTLLRPLFAAAGVVDRALARLFGVAASQREKVEPAQREMLLGVFALADTMVTEVMTPRVDLVGVDVALPFEAAVKAVATAEYSRLPAYDGDLDHIVGVLHAKDLLPVLFAPAPADTAWRALLRPADIVPETKTLDAQLRDFQRGPANLVVVVDEFGGTAGIVTMEDVLEEVVGEIRDEYDAAPEPTVRTEAPGVFVADGRVPLDDLSAALGAPFARDDVQTAGGLVVAELGHVPEKGDAVQLHGYRVTVEQVTRRTVSRLRFERHPEAGPGAAP
jgi:CBS domain containing-hemolysin-like protein